MSATPNNQHGSLETAVAGQYDFTIGEVLSEAWARIDGYKLPYAIITSVYFLVYFIAFFNILYCIILNIGSIKCQTIFVVKVVML